MTDFVIESTAVECENSSSEGRILALDFGKRRIGMAISDPLRLIATGLSTLTRTTIREDLEHIARVAAEHEVRLFLLGHPLNMDGTEGKQALNAREFGGRLQRKTGIPMQLWDERLTSVEAEEMLRERGERPDRRSGTVDRLAAALLLQRYLDHHHQAESEAEWSAGE